MKVYSLLFLFIIMIKYIELEKLNEVYLVVTDDIKGRTPFNGFSVYDSSERRRFYQLKAFSTPELDTLVLIDYPEKNIVANMEGEWTENIFNVSFSVYDYNLHTWTDGTIKRSAKYSINHTIEWKSERFIMKRAFFSYTTKLFDARQTELLCTFRRRSRWYNSRTKYNLNIYSDKLPHAIYLFGLAIVHYKDYIVITD